MTFPGIEPRNVLRHLLDYRYNRILVYSCSLVLKPFMQMTRNTELRNCNITHKTALNRNVRRYSR